MAERGGTPESEWEEDALEHLGERGWVGRSGSEIAPGTQERERWDDLVIPSRLFEALRRLNPDVPDVYLRQAREEILAPRSNDPVAENQRVHEWLVEGFREVVYTDTDGQEVTPTIRLISADPRENDWLAVNQVTVRDREYRRRFDVVLYCNGMPVSIIELKKAGSSADTTAAHAQLQTYLREFPMAFRFSVFVLVSDIVSARYGTPFTEWNHFSPWNVDDEGNVTTPGTVGPDGEVLTGLHMALHGLYEPERFLDLLRFHTAFDGGAKLVKRIAKPHQYFAVRKAVDKTTEAVQSDGKAGVVWHTQGSGKSMEMELYTNLVMRHPALLNPTVVVITDRRELDGQLFRTFERSLLLPERPRQIRRRNELRAELTNRTTGGIYFTTLQKFSRTGDETENKADHPLLSDRRNIILIVDEAHRSHYDDLDGYAYHLRKALPHATLIAFTGTPISFDDRDTREVFGPYIDTYDLSRAVKEGATVPVLFAPRLIKVSLKDGMSEEDLDRVADEATVGLDDAERTKIEHSVTVMNRVYGAPDRLRKLAADIVEHWEARREALLPEIGVPGKGLIVCGTRDICARLYTEVVALRPDWHSPDLHEGRIKVVYHGERTDKPPISNHSRRASENETIKERLRRPEDELELVIVKDMMLTGYDSQPLHTLYLDRPLKGALLMQTLARVNRTFRGKDAGLLVGYAPVAENLQKALAEYSATDQEERPVGQDIAKAVAALHELLDALRAALSRFDRSGLRSPRRGAFSKTAMSAANYLRDPANNQAAEGEERLADRFRRLSGKLARAWALCVRSEDIEQLRPEVLFYEEVRVVMAKFDAEARRAEGRPVPDDIERLLAAAIADSTEAGEVLDIYDAAGLPKPDLSDLDLAAYTEHALKAPNRQLAIEALRRTVMSEGRRVTQNNVVRGRLFSERVTELMNRYANQQLTAAEVIAALAEMAQEAAQEPERGRQFDPPLSDDELAFYDAVAENASARLEQGSDVLAQIARELVAIMRRDVRTDWTVREDVRAKLRSSIKRLLVKYRYPPDKQPGAITLVLEQMEHFAPRYAEPEQGHRPAR